MPNFRGTAGRIITSQAGTPIVNRTKNLNFLGGATVVDAGGGQADVTTSGGLAAGWKAAINVNFSDPSPISLYLAQINDMVITTQVVVTEAFDDPAATITVGDAGVNDRHFEASMCDLTQLNEYESNEEYKYLAVTQINVYLNPGASTQGRATILIEIRP